MQIKYRKNDYFDIVSVQLNNYANIKEEINSEIIKYMSEKNHLSENDYIDILNITYLENRDVVAIVEFAIICG